MARLHAPEEARGTDGADGWEIELGNVALRHGREVGTGVELAFERGCIDAAGRADADGHHRRGRVAVEKRDGGPRRAR
jgi:hypothetical protein